MSYREARRTYTKSYTGATARHYERFSDAGLAPEIVCISANEIVAIRCLTLKEWLDEKRSPEELAVMKQALADLLLAAHKEVGLCHRDALIDNFVLSDSGRPLLIDFDFATPSVNEHCYDLEGPEASGVRVPAEHLSQGGDTAFGIWWGSPEKTRSLEIAFGPT